MTPTNRSRKRHLTSTDYVLDVEFPQKTIKRVRVKGPTLEGHRRQAQSQAKAAQTVDEPEVKPRSCSPTASVCLSASTCTPDSSAVLSAASSAALPTKETCEAEAKDSPHGTAVEPIASSTVCSQVVTVSVTELGKESTVVSGTPDDTQPQGVTEDTPLDVRLDNVEDQTIATTLHSILSQLLERNKKEGKCRELDEVAWWKREFFLNNDQAITLLAYLKRIAAYLPLDTLVTALVYMDRMYSSHPDMALSSANVHLLFITACMLAAKYLEDEPYAQEFYARVGCIETVEEMNRMEVYLLKMLDWRLHVDRDTYFGYYGLVADRHQSLSSVST